MLFLCTMFAPPIISTPTWGASMNVDASSSSVVRITVAGTTTINMLTNGVDGQTIRLELKQDGTGGRSITLGTGFIFGTDITGYSPSAGANKTDILGLVYSTAAAGWRVMAIAKGY